MKQRLPKSNKKAGSFRSRHFSVSLHRHPFALPVTLAVVAAFGAMFAFVSLGAETLGPSDSRVVQVFVDGDERIVPTRASDVGDLLERLDISLASADVVEPALDTPIQTDGFVVNVYRARTVRVVDGGNARIVLSADPDPRTVATKAGLNLFDEDLVEVVPITPDPAQILNQGVVAEQVTVDRSQAVKLNLYGVAYDIRTQATTVGGLLSERNIDISGNDQSVFPLPDAVIDPSVTIFVTDPTNTIELVEEPIAQGEERVNDFSLELGQTSVRDEGVPGVRAVVYAVDDAGQRTVLQNVVLKAPIPRTVAVGQKIPTIAVSGDKSAVLSSAGIPADQHYAADFIISRESGWRVTAQNPSSGAYGLCQSLPGSKMASAGADWQTNPITQLRWCNSYAFGRYGNWHNAYQFWLINHWW